MKIAYTQEPYSPSALTPSGRVLLAAMRRARAGAAATLACFVDACGEARGRPCFVVFLQIVHGLALYGRRRMRVGSDKWPILTHDEVALLRCVDAGMRGGEAALAAHVAWLVRGYGTGEFAAYIRTLASLMPETMFQDAEGESPVALDGDPAGRSVAERLARGRAAPAFPIAIK
jgi:hypothetical protein